MKKILTVALAAASAVCMFAACNEPGKEKSGAEFTYEYENPFPPESMTILKGAYEEKGGVITSLERDSIGFFTDKPFNSGSLSVKMKANDKSDNGIMMAFDCSEGTDYKKFYALQINKDGVVMFCKIESGFWQTPFSFKIRDYNEKKEYRLKLSWKGVETDESGNKTASIDCFYNDCWIYTYKDEAPLDFDKYGLKTGGKGVKYSDLTVSETVSEKTKDMSGAYKMEFYGVVGDEENGYDFSARSAITTKDDLLIDNKKISYTVTPDVNQWTSVNLMLDSTPIEGETAAENNFEKGINVFFGRKEIKGTAYTVIAAERWGGDWKSFGNYIICKWEEFDKTRSYNLTASVNGSDLIVYLDGKAALFSKIDRSDEPKKLYFWARTQVTLSDIKIEDYTAETGAEYNAAFGSALYGGENIYGVNVNSAITSATENKIDDNKTIKFIYRPQISNWPDLRMIFDTVTGDDSARFPKGLAVMIRTIEETDAETKAKVAKVKVIVQQRYGSWQTYGSAEICKYEDFDFTKDYFVSVAIYKTTVAVSIDGKEVLKANGVIRGEYSNAYFWNPGSQTYTLKDITVTEEERGESYTAAFGTVVGDDENGYTVSGGSAITAADAVTVKDAEVTVSFKAEAGAWPDIRVMFDADSIGDESKRFPKGFGVQIKVENGKIKMVCQERSDWAMYGQAEICDYTDFDFTAEHTLKITLTGNKLTAEFDGTKYLDNVTVGRKTQSKLYVWNAGSKNLNDLKITVK